MRSGLIKLTAGKEFSLINDTGDDRHPIPLTAWSVDGSDAVLERPFDIHLRRTHDAAPMV